MKLLALLTIAVAVVASVSAGHVYDVDKQVDEYVEFVQGMAKNSEMVETFDKNIKKLVQLEPNYFNYTPPGFDFNCQTKFDEEEKKFEEEEKLKDRKWKRTVHQLRAQDIQVVGAIGDSITAGIGIQAKTVLGLLVEYSGSSWSIGGQGDLKDAVTLPNMLKKFNPKLRGAATGSNILKLPFLKRGLDKAVSGSEASNLLDQAKKLIRAMELNPYISYKNDWKMLTLFVGGNDLCRSCKGKPQNEPEAYIADIKETLDYLHKHVPKAFVNLVPTVDATQIKDVNGGLVCDVLHFFLCKCAAYPENKEAEKKLHELVVKYQNSAVELANSGRYDTRKDFTVVSQPFMINFRAPEMPNGEPDVTFLAPDCFHFSRKGHAGAAIGLWNNLWTPVGKKSKTWKPDDKVICPTRRGRFFYTNKNSGL